MTYPPQFNAAVAFTLQQEGGLVNNPNDPGGLSNHGFALNENSDLTARAIIDMTVDQATARYYAKWWAPYSFGLLPWPFSAKTFDESVNMGPVAIKLLQVAINDCGGAQIAVDGGIGPATAAACAAAPPLALQSAFTKRLMDHYTAIVRANPGEAAFTGNWDRRAQDWGFLSPGDPVT
jgi:lysozyme family protein